MSYEIPTKTAEQKNDSPPTSPSKGENSMSELEKKDYKDLYQDDNDEYDYVEEIEF